MSHLDKLIEMRAKKAEIQAMERDVQPRLESLKAEYDEKTQAILEPLIKKAEEYKAELKAAFGITDGERTDVLDTVSMVLRVARD